MLAVKIDGIALPEAEAKAMWERFSAWMEEHRGDLAGFARQEGFTSVHPGVEGGQPVLLLSKEGAQRPYAPVAHDESSPPRSTVGSNKRQSAPRSPQDLPGKRRK